ncbi:UNVERIFIED_CONTAM: hypothetical protein FKN15_010567 [Acipenser sinensis]
MEIAQEVKPILKSLRDLKSNAVWFPAYYTFSAIWNFSDASLIFGQELGNLGLIQHLVAILDHKPYKEKQDQKNVYYLVKASLCILHNVAKVHENRPLLHQENAVQRVSSYTKVEDELLKVVSIMLLGYIIDEDESDLIMDESGAIENMLRLLQGALTAPNCRCRGYRSEEIAEGLGLIATCEKNKIKSVGIKVWMDVEHMAGSTLQAMAEAVEKAYVVVICISPKYKESPNCRTGPIVPSNSNQQMANKSVPVVSTWTKEDFAAWLKENKLDFRLTLFAAYDGPLMHQLQQLRKEEQPRSVSNASGSESEREGHRDDDDDDEDRDAGQPSNKDLFGDDSEDEHGSQHSGSDNRSERSDNQSEASVHSEQEDNEHSDVEQHSGSEGHHDEEDGGHRSNMGSPQSEAGSPRSEAPSPRSEVPSPRSEAASTHSEAGSPRSEVASPRSEAASPRSEAASPMSHAASPHSEAEGSGKEAHSEDEKWAKSDESDDEAKPQRSDEEHRRSDDEDEEQREHKSESPKGSDSEDDFVRQKHKKTVASDSDSDSDVGGHKESKPAADDLFGEADDISSDSDTEKPTTPGQPLDNEDGMDADHPEEEPVPETRIEVEIPKVNTDLGSDLYFVKLPNFLSVEPRPFDPQYYEDEFEDEEMLDEEGRTRLKLKVENTIRWKTRRDEDGTEIRESNARIVKWSDGSMSLHLGNEVFDVYKAPLQGDHNHLFIRQGTGLQGQAVFKTKLTFRPHSTDSATHRKMTLSLADRCSKTQKIRILPMAGRDPESQRNEMIKKEEERLRASIRRESQQRRMREKQHQRGLSTNYLEPDRYEEEEEGEESISLAAIKSKYRGGSGIREERARIYSSDSDEGSDEDRAQRLLKAKKLDSDEEGESSGKRKAEDDDDDDDDHEKSVKKPKKYVISDEEDEEDE